LSALAPLLGKPNQINDLNPILPIIDSLLPNSAFLEEERAKGLAIERVEKLGSVEFLNLATFLISNNFPGEASSKNLRDWLKYNGSTSILTVLSSMEGPTAEALVEKKFRFAIEAEDIPTVKYLIKAGVNPNGHACRDPRIPEDLTPLQFACIQGNTELAQELIKAGSRIDQPDTGWKSSALVLAIIGENL
jgi:Ankyrin repeats (3 copies)